MSHPIYNRQQLLNRGLVKVKSIAHDLGVIPTGDKRLIQSWVDAIVEHQAAQVQKIVEAVIDFDGESFEGATQPYMVIVNSEVVHRATTYQQAERYCKWHSLALVDSQALAQQELEVDLEVQAPAHPLPKERCECGDTHFRGVECKHQLAVKNEIASRISFISPADFGYYEAIVDNDIHHVIAKIEYLDQSWNVEMVKKSKTLVSYEEAEQFIKEEYVKGVFMHRGSGRITQPIEDMGMTIEDSHLFSPMGQSYTLRINGALAGDIFLDDDHGWTINGEDFNDDWQPVAKNLIKLTRHEYLLAA